MTKPFLQDNKREREARKSFVFKLGGIALVLVLLFLAFYFRSGLSYFANSLTRPFVLSGVEAKEGSANVFNSLSSKSSLLSEIKRLNKELDNLDVYKIEIVNLRIENNRLNDLFNRTNNDDAILAKVLTVPGKTMFDTVLLDTGKNNSQQNIEPGDTVRISENILIGDISEVFSKVSRAVLFSSPGRLTEVSFGEDETRILATGLGGGNFEAIAPKNILVKTGDLVYSPGHGGKVVGIVEIVLDEPSDPSIEIRFRLPVNPYELRELFIYEREVSS